MGLRTLAICGATSATLAVFGCDAFALASDGQSSDQTHGPTGDGKRVERAHRSARSHLTERHRKTTGAPASKTENEKGDPTKAPWFEVDPDRATIPSAAKESDSAKPKSSVPTAKWAKDKFDFGYKVNGSNDFRMLPRFDINESPPGAGGQVGVNLHFWARRLMKSACF